MNPNSEIGKCLHLISDFSLLPSSKVDDCFIKDLMSNQPLSEKLEEFFRLKILAHIFPQI